MFEQYTQRFQKLAAALLAALMLAGCVQTNPQPSTDPSGTTEPSVTTTPTAPSETEGTEPPITEPPIETPPPTLEPVTGLSCTKWKTYPDLLSLGGGIVFASRNYYSADHNGIINSMELIDVYNDTLIASVTTNSAREPILQRFPDGAILTADTKSGTMYVYDSSLNLKDSFCVPSTEGFFSYDRTNYYFVDSDVLYRMDVSTGNRGRMSLEKDLRLESLLSIHPTEDLLLARVHLSPYTIDYGLALINAKTGKLRLLTDDLTHLWLTGDMFYGVEMNEQIYGYDVCYGSLSGGEVKRITTDVLGGDTVGYSVLPGSHLLLRRKAPDVGEWNTTLFDLASGGTAADMAKYDFADALFSPIYLSEEQLILGLRKDGFFYTPTLIDPKALTFEEGLTPETVEWGHMVDCEVADRYWNEPELPAALSELRAQADTIEKKYGVTILIGNQTADTCAYSGFTIQTSEDAALIQSALTKLDTALALYPNGFAGQFRNDAREGGLYFCLTGSIEDDLGAVGISRLNRWRYNLVLDITADDLDKTIHHEIWHAIEMRISTDSFNTKKWSSCNPNGFSYYGKYDKGYRDLTRWTYTGGNGTGSYFVDPYARINGREDRARIMEYVMTTNATDLMKSSALRQKLQIMSDTIRRHFDTKGWTDVYWEQYL